MDDEALDLAHAYALDTLDADEQNRLDSLLTSADSDFRAEFDAIVRETHDTLAALDSTVAAAPPPGLRDRLLAQIAAESQTAHAAQSAPTPIPSPPTSLTDARSRRRGWQVAVAAAAAAVVLLVGGTVIGYNLRGAEEPAPAAAVINASDARAVAADIGVGGSATVVYSRSEDAAVVLFDDLTSPAADKVYQMWLIADSSPESVGLITAEQAEAGAPTIIEDIGDAKIFALTVEPSGGSPAPTTDPFLALEL